MKDLKKEIIGFLLNLNIDENEIKNYEYLIDTFLEKNSFLISFHEKLLDNKDLIKTLGESIVKDMEL
jgi:hypothetical protein